VLLSARLARAGVPLGAALRGKPLSTHVLASTSNGCQVVARDPSACCQRLDVVPLRKERTHRITASFTLVR
jgi:hypothetical protein